MSMRPVHAKESVKKSVGDLVKMKIIRFFRGTRYHIPKTRRRDNKKSRIKVRQTYILNEENNKDVP